MRNNTLHKKPLRGSSIVQDSENMQGELALEPWVGGLRSCRGNTRDSIVENQKERIIPSDDKIGKQSHNEERWQDAGGKSGEVV